MFAPYQTLDQVVQAGGLEHIKLELNAYPLYTRMVRLFGFTEIGIKVVDEQGQEQGRYASCNNRQGQITEIAPHFTNPSIVVQAEEKYLVEILHRAEWVKEHLAVAIMEYWRAFSVVQGKYPGIHHYVVDFFSRFMEERKSAPPHPSG